MMNKCNGKYAHKSRQSVSCKNQRFHDVCVAYLQNTQYPNCMGSTMECKRSI